MNETDVSAPTRDRQEAGSGYQSVSPQASRAIEDSPAVCNVDGCETPAKVRGLCGKHYQKAYYHQTITTRAYVRGGRQGTCAVEGCEQPIAAKGLCITHYKRERRYGDAVAVPEREHRAPIEIPANLTVSQLARLMGVSRQRIDQLKSPDKRRARQRLKTAIESGEVVKAQICARCFEPGANLHGHHWDYAYPLDVTWYCPKCHGAVHAALRRQHRAPVGAAMTTIPASATESVVALELAGKRGGDAMEEGS